MNKLLRTLMIAFAFIAGYYAHPMADEIAFVLARGTVNQTGLESDQCIAAIGFGPDAGTVQFHPANMVCKRLTELAGPAEDFGARTKGKSGRLVFVVEGE